MEREMRNCYAWINQMPLSPKELHVICEVTVNIGETAMLIARVPQNGDNELILEVHSSNELKGTYSQQWLQCRYDVVLPLEVLYNTVKIYNGNNRETIDVHIIS